MHSYSWSLIIFVIYTAYIGPSRGYLKPIEETSGLSQSTKNLSLTTEDYILKQKDSTKTPGIMNDASLNFTSKQNFNNSRNVNQTTIPLPKKRKLPKKVKLDRKKIKSEMNLTNILYNDIFRDYDKNVRPFNFSNSEPLEVSIKISLMALLYVDEMNQQITTSSQIITEWFDPNLSWNPKSYLGETYIKVPEEKIWRPDVVLYNSATMKYDQNVRTYFVEITSDGIVRRNEYATLKTYCNFDLQWYPFDQQECKMEFATGSYSTEQIVFIHPKATLNLLRNNNQFDILNFTVEQTEKYYPCCHDKLSTLIFKVNYYRTEGYYTYNMITGAVILNMAGLVVFIVPMEMQEKIEVSTKAIFGMIIYFMGTIKHLPPTEKLPLSGLFFLICLLVMTMSIIATVIVMAFKYAGESHQKPPKWLRSFSNILARFLLLSPPIEMESLLNTAEELLPKSSIIEKRKRSNVSEYGCIDAKKHFKSAFHQKFVWHLEDLMKSRWSRLEKQERKIIVLIIKEEWNYIARVFERFFMIISILFMFFFSAFFLTSAPPVLVSPVKYINLY